MTRCCDALFSLAETEVAMTTMISSHVKDKIPGKNPGIS